MKIKRFIYVFKAWYVVNRDFFNNTIHIWRGLPYVNAIHFFLTKKSQHEFYKELVKIKLKYWKKGYEELHGKNKTN